MDIDKDIWTVVETVIATRTVYVKATSRADALRAARNEESYDWGDLDFNPSKTTYKNPKRER